MSFLSNSKLLKLVTTREIKKYAQCLYYMEGGKIQLKCMARLQNKLGGHFSLIIVLLSELPVIRPSIFMSRPNQWLQKCMLSRRVCSYTYGFYLPKFCNAIWEWFLWTMSCVWYTYSLVKKYIYSPRVYCILVPYLQVLQLILLSWVAWGQGFLLFDRTQLIEVISLS